MRQCILLSRSVRFQTASANATSMCHSMIYAACVDTPIRIIIDKPGVVRCARNVSGSQRIGPASVDWDLGCMRLWLVLWIRKVNRRTTITVDWLQISRTPVMFRRAIIHTVMIAGMVIRYSYHPGEWMPSNNPRKQSCRHTTTLQWLLISCVSKPTSTK